MPVLSAARLLLSLFESLACRARPSHQWNGLLNALKTSNRQIEANRMNGKRSTGPKTAAGKERASGNALRHGLSRRRTKGDLEAEHVIAVMIAKLGARFH
jgi:hypothetical protein